MGGVAWTATQGYCQAPPDGYYVDKPGAKAPTKCGNFTWSNPTKTDCLTDCKYNVTFIGDARAASLAASSHAVAQSRFRTYPADLCRDGRVARRAQTRPLVSGS